MRGGREPTGGGIFTLSKNAAVSGAFTPANPETNPAPEPSGEKAIVSFSINGVAGGR
ncbi:MAG: hypothetical protein LBD58_02945 [Treponema sp.]|nr:hypothetical protein [Treponema sp.]